MTTTIARLAAALALAVASDAFAAPQMYKCVENGRTVYQQQACNPQPQAEAAASAAHPASSAASDAHSAATKKVRRPSPASSAPATPR
ncbi:MAG TPA: hypothetical protein VFF43_09455 [Caldimonas sp.]|nr:hypothetical protein [Caldimonas sp.]